MENKTIQGVIYQAHDPFHITFKPRSTTNTIVIHCAATQPKSNIDWKAIDQMHRQRGFLAIGYHFVITVDGTIQEGRPLEAIGSHAKGWNNNSIGICLVGGVDKNNKPVNNFSKAQFKSLDKLVKALCQEYNGEIKAIMGHRDLPGVKKDCPCFDAKARYKEVLKNG